MNLQNKLSQLSGVGPKIAKRLEKLNIFTIEDLIYHFPFRYEDFSHTSKIADAKLGETVTLAGEVWQIKNAYTRFRKVITKAVLNDGTGSIELVWFNQPYLTKAIQSGDKLQVAGVVIQFGSKLSIMVPDWEKALPQNSGGLHTGRLVPVYPETSGISSKWIRNELNKIFPIAKPKLEEFMPDQIRNGMILLPEALEKIHFPKDHQDIKEARNRLGFDELFLIQLATQKTRYLWKNKPLIKSWKVTDKDIETFVSSLPFILTSAQKKVLNELVIDLKKHSPMNRLLQGEVGSGKTVVAAATMYLAHLNGFQSILMAPTEILAWQHQQTVQKTLEPFGIKVSVFTRNKRGLLKEMTQNPPDVVIGTHALLSEAVKLDRVGLVIVDEQHRFGVEQRTILRKKGAAPHFLTMTATPIPRTVALTLYSDLDLSIIDELPKNRPSIKTHLVSEHKRSDAYKFIEKKIKAGDQAFVITPLIEESETLVSAKAAKVEYEKLKNVFPNLNLGLLHGRMKSKEKEEAIENFRSGKIHLLVSTSVVEVGMDIPNATIMVIEGAQRFGLAQLHQLRGRIGRGSKESFCLLFTEGASSAEKRRLKYLEKIFNGLKLAELDMKIRGIGQIFGTAQHGRFDLKIARLSDLALVEKTKETATNLLQKDPTLDKYPNLRAKLSSLAQEVMPD